MLKRNSVRVNNYRLETKKLIVSSLGGQCVICGYSKCLRGLIPHHLVAKDKKFSFGSCKANYQNWGLLVEELRKCVLLCCNCHAEVHAGVVEVPVNAVKFDEAYSSYTSLPCDGISRYSRYIPGITQVDKGKICEYCGNTFQYKDKHQRFCSHSCSTKSLKRNPNLTKEALAKLIDQFNNSQIAKILGVSNRTITDYRRMFNI